MSFFTKLIGGGLLKTGKEITQIISDVKAKKLDTVVALKQLERAGEDMQGEINKIEAKHPSVFVSGWRPAAGWVCVIGLGYSFLVRPIVNGIISAIYMLKTGQAPTFELFVAISVGELIALLSGMLGLGISRSWEKKHDVARD